jgi:outer membrane biosynthesis protein TonB
VLIEEREEEEPPEEKVQDVKSEEAKKAEKEEIKKEDVKKPKVEEKKPVSTGQTVDPTERKKQVVEAVAKKTIAGALLGAGGAATKLFGEAGEGEEGSVVAKTFGAGATEQDGPGSGGLALAGGGGGGGTVEKVPTGAVKAGFGARSADQTKVAANKVEKKVVISFSSGSLGGSGTNKEQIGKVIARKASAVRRCYENALRQQPNLSGKVTVNFTVGTAGTVTNVSVLGATGDFADCIRGKFTSIRGLPLLTSPQSFNQSYVFTKS